MSALRYAAMNERGRAQERRQWRAPYASLAERCRPYPHADSLCYSLPVPPEPDSAVQPFSAVGAYRFERLGSIREFVNAGAALDNCLAELPSYFSDVTVLAVRREDKTVAAVQLKGRRVVQALARRNRRIDPEAPLGKALCAWAERCGLQLPAPEEEAAFTE